MQIDDLSGGKPELTEADEARILVLLPLSKYQSKKINCAVTQTPISRPPVRMYPPEVKDFGLEPQLRDTIVPFFCDLNVRDKGGNRVDFTVVEIGQQQPAPPSAPRALEQQRQPAPQASQKSSRKPIPTASLAPREQKDSPDGQKVTPVQPTQKIENTLLQDSVEVHALYRYRVMTGPAYTSLSTKRKTYSAKQDSTGQKIISSDVDGNLPVDLPLLLKIYWSPEGRDLYADPLHCFNESGLGTTIYKCLQMLNPVVGFNMTDSPFNNFYVGLSLEFLRGFDIVGGFHWSKIKTLSDGFVEGQTTTLDSIPTKTKFLQGWFLGVSLDVGLAATWLSKSAIDLFKN
jgi:hypothetical protein